MQDEILAKAIDTDASIIPRYNITTPGGTIIASNVQIDLVNTVSQAGTKWSKGNVLSDDAETAVFGSPQNATPSEAIASLANTVTREYLELVGEMAVDATGSLQTIIAAANMPVGWSVENLVGLYLEGELTITGAYNNDDGNKTSWLILNDDTVATHYFPELSGDYYSADSVDVLQFNAKFWGVGGTEDSKKVGIRTTEKGLSSFTEMQTVTLSVENDLVTTFGSALGFYYNTSYDFRPCAGSCVGTVKLYAIRKMEV